MSGLYVKYKEELMRGNINMITSNLSIVLVDSIDYIFNSSHASMVSVPTIAISAPSVLLTGKTVTGDVFGANDVAFPAVAVGDTVEAAIIFLDTGTVATSVPIAYLNNGTGFSIIPSGGGVNIVWSTNPAGIFRL